MQYCQPPYRLENVMRLIAFCLEKLLYRHKPSHTKEKGTGDSISSIWSPPDIAMDRIQRNGSGDFGRHHHNALASGNRLKKCRRIRKDAVETSFRICIVHDVFYIIFREEAEMKEHTGKQGFAALCMSLFFIFLFFGSALFTAQMAQNIQGISLRSRFCDDTSLACGLLNPPEQFHLQRGNPNSKTGLRTQPFYGAAGGNSAALQDLILSLAVSAAFLRNPDFRPSIRFLTKHCPVRAGPVF